MQINFLNIIAVFTGGGFGATLRYIITKLSYKYLSLPILGTFVANLLGCLLIGYILGLALQKAELISPTLRLFLVVGFLGGLTTFSTFSNEAYCFIKEGKILLCLVYIIGSFSLGLLSTYFGYILAK